MLTALLTAALGLAPAPELDYASLAEDYVREHELTAEEAASVDALLDSPHFLHVDLGAFDVRLPVEGAADRTHAKVFQQALRDFLELQLVWSTWVLESPEDRERVEDAAKELGKLVKKLSASRFKEASRSEGATLFDQLEVGEDVRAAEATLRDLLAGRRDAEAGSDGDAGAAAGGGTRVRARIVLIPTREEYVKLAAFAGKVDERRRVQLWHRSMPEGINAWTDDAQIVVLEWPVLPLRPEAPFRGQSMNFYEKTGQREHLVDRAAASLLWNHFHYVTVPEMETALTVGLVVAVVGQDSLTGGVKSFEWSRAGASTEPYERFVPGGNPAGGTLPARLAVAGPMIGWGDEEPIWERTRARDLFAEALHDSQKRGAKLGVKQDELDDARRRSRLPHFAVTGRTESDTHAVTAPFLGALAEDAPIPPAAYLDDYEDFFRCYRASFFHWLRTEGAGKESADRFAALLEATRTQAAERGFDALVREVYGVELSSLDPEAESLEWRYLAWLAKQ